MNFRVLMVQLFSDMLGNPTLHPENSNCSAFFRYEQTTERHGKAMTNVAKMRTTTRRRKYVQMGACAAYL